MIHVVNTESFYIFHNQQFACRLKARVAPGISQMELRAGGRLILGSAQEETLSVLILLHKGGTKFKFQDRQRPSWGPVRARRGVFVVPNDEGDIVVAGDLDLSDVGKQPPDEVETRGEVRSVESENGATTVAGGFRGIKKSRLVLYNCASRSTEVYDTYDSPHYMKQFAGLQGGVLQGRDEGDKLFLFKLD